MKRSLKTLLYGYDIEQFILPASIWALFLLLCVVFFEQEQAANSAGAFLGMVMPLLGGILAAYSLLNDSILELRFSTSCSSWRMLMERFALLFGFMSILAISFQGVIALDHIPLDRWGNLFERQLLWAIPCAAAMALGILVSFLAGNAMTGAGISGGYWIFQMIMRGWLSEQPVLQYAFFFQALEKDPGSSAVIWNQISLTVITFSFIILSGLLLKRQERYIK